MTGRSWSRILLAALAVAGCTSENGGVSGILIVSRVDISPPGGTIRVGATLPLTATPRTESGIPVPDRTVTWTTSSSGVASVSTTGVAFGVSAGGPVTITAMVDGVSGQVSVNVVPIPIARIEILPPTPTLTVGQSIQLTARAYDDTDNELTDKVFAWTSEAQSIAAVTTLGVLVGNSPGGPVGVSAMAESKTATAMVTVTARPATRLGFGVQPRNTPAGTAFTPSVQVALQDDVGLTVPTASASVTLAMGANPGGGTLQGTRTANTVNGVATFPGLSIDRSGSGYSLLATAQTFLSATSVMFDILATNPSKLLLASPPGTPGAIGIPSVPPAAVQLADPNNNLVGQAGVTITASIASGPAGATLVGTTQVQTNAAGLATFSTLAVAGAAGTYTLAFSSTGLAGVVTGPIVLTTGPATQLVLAAQPSSTAGSGIPFPVQPSIQLRDAGGNAVTQGGVAVTASLATGGSNGTLQGVVTVQTNGAGLALFGNLAIAGATGSYSIQFLSPGLPPVTSGTITLGAGAASVLTMTTQPSATAQSGILFTSQPVIQIRDQIGNPVAQAGVQVTAALVGAGGALAGTTTQTTNVSGIAVFTNLSITGVVGAYSIRFTATNTTPVTSSTIDLRAGPAAALVILTEPSPTAQNSAPFTTQPAVQIRDAAGNPVALAGVSITASIASGAGTLGGTLTATTDAGGAARFTDLRITGAIGPRTLRFATAGLTGSTSSVITVAAGPAARLALTRQPSGTASSGVAFPQQPIVQVQDVSGNPVAASVTVTAVIASGDDNAMLGGTTAVSSTGAGIATFANLEITGPSGPYTLSFSSPGLTSTTSGAILIGAGAGIKLSLTTQPAASAQSGAVFAPQPVVQLLDASDNAVMTAGVLVTVVIESGGPALGGPTTVATNAGGAAQFAGLRITGLAGIRTLRFSASGFTDVVSNNVNITAGPAAALAITTGPSSTARNGDPIAQHAVLQLVDAGGNSVTAAGVMITASIGSGPGVLSGTLSRQTGPQGTVTFDDLVITGTVGAYTLHFAAPSLTGATSGTITLTAGNPAKLSLTTPPSAVAQNAMPFSQQPVLQLRDQSDNTVAMNNVPVAASIASGAGVLGGMLIVQTNAAGGATFTDLTITGTIGPRTLDFTSAGLTKATSPTITVIPGAAAKISANSVTSQSAPIGQDVAAPPSVLVTDLSDNPVAAVPVAFGVTAGGGTVAPASPVTVATAATGIATATRWTLGLTIGANNNTVEASATGLSGNPVVFTASAIRSPPDTVTITTAPSAAAQNDQALATQPVIQLRDRFGNPFDSALVTITATIANGPAGATLSGAAAQTLAGGAATFNGLTIRGPVGNYTLRFAAAGLKGAVSGTVVLSAGAAAKIAANSASSQSTTVGMAVGAPPSVLVTDVSDNPVAGFAVAFAVTAGGGTVVPASPTTVTTGANGIAAATSWTIGTVAGSNNNTVGATGTGLLGSPVVFTASGTPDVADTLSIATQPSGAANNDQAFTQQPVIRLRDQFGNLVSQSGVAVTAQLESGPAGAVLGGTLTATTLANGTATFSTLKITGTIGAYTLRFTAPSLKPAISGTITLGAGAGAKIAANSATNQSAPIGDPVGAPPSVVVRDVSDNLVQGQAVAFSVTAGGGIVVPGSPATVLTDAAGVATATSWTLGATIGANNNTVNASAPGLTGSPVTFTASGTQARADTIAIATEPPATATNDQAFSANTVIQLRDRFGNPVDTVGVMVTASIASGPAGAVLGGTVTRASVVGGAVTFDDLKLTGMVGTYTLRFTGSALKAAVSTSIALGPGVAAAITENSLTTQTAPVNTAVADPPSVLVTDVSGNPVPGEPVAFAVTAGGGTVVPASPATVTTSAQGVATATSWTLGPTVGTNNNSVGAAVPGLAAGPVVFSATATMLPDSLIVVTQPLAGPSNNTPFSQEPVVRLVDAIGTPVARAGVAVTVTIESDPGGGGALIGTVTVLTDPAGIADFAGSGLGLRGPSGAYTLRFTASGVPKFAVSVPINH